MMENFEFMHPQFFWALTVLPIAIVWYVFKHKKLTPAVRISNVTAFKMGNRLLPKLKPILFALRLLALAALITAMARPRTVDVSTRTKKTEGIDIIITVDVSASMLAKDLRPNRLEALKRVAGEFIQGRPNDRIGIVEYAGESFTKTPITSDKTIVLSALKSVRYNNVIEGGTAIGMGLATAVNRLKDSRAKSKVIILMTDGENNAGFIDPKIASELALEFGIKVYTIGMGTKGLALSPYAIRRDGSFEYQKTQVNIDEDLLKEIAKTTGGQYFRATNNKKLKDIYNEIDKLERTEVEEFKYTNYEEMYRPLLWIAGVLLLLEFLLKYTVFRSFV